MSSVISQEVCGQRLIKSDLDVYLSAISGESRVDLWGGSPNKYEKWYVEDWGGKVVFKTFEASGGFMRAQSNYMIDLVSLHPKNCPELFWTPHKNSNGTWSFESCHGTWLSFSFGSTVCCDPKLNLDGEFLLPNW